MPAKKGGKKGKKQDDDDEFWEKKAAALELQAKEAEEEERNAAKSSGGFGAFDMLDDDEEEGGLLSTINKGSSKKKDKKSKKKRAQFDDDEDEDLEPKAQEADDGDAQPTPAPVDTAVNLDDEWPEEDVKPKKGKKGKKGKKVVQDDDEDDWFVKPEEEKKEEVKAAEAEPEEQVKEEPKAVATPPPEPAGDEEENDGPKILTKAQKEKLKKEKEKAKKKAQAAAKKAQSGTPAPAAESPSQPEPTPAAADAEEDDGEEEGAGGDKKKKKKKKAAAKPADSAPAAKGKKVPAHILAMQAAMEEKKRLEEEAAAAEAERIRLIEEEDARIAAEEARIAEQKAAKKAKEKEKMAKAKAEGRALTPAQKREKAAAEARKAAMLASGVVVAGLQETGEEKKKKPTYGKKKPVKKDDAASKPAASASPKPAEPEPTPAAAKAESEDDWDKEDEEDAAAVENLVAGVDKLKVEESEDDWDVSDEEPAPKPAAPASEPKKEEAKPKAQPSPAKPAPAAAKPAAKAPTKANGKAAPPPEESSSEEESSDEDSDEETDSEDESDSEDELEVRKAQALQRIQERQKAAEAAKTKEDLRSPICCILGHVDTGKTKLLDKIRQTSVQEGEAGGITQQIGATFFPKAAIQEKTAVVNKNNYEVQVPGLLIIDTPGHESFTNLRTRGSSLCNIAILVVDITHGLEPQTIESLNLLRNGKTPFIVALNKIDRMYGWKATPNGGFRDTLAQQSDSVKSEFEDRVKKTKLAFAEQGLNAEIFDENKNLARNVSLVPTSAITGEGIPDMLMLLIKLTQERMNQSLMFITELECTILEVKIVEGLGTTLDVVLSNGKMKEGDRIVLCGMDGPIVTTVRALLTPQPMREMRVKSAYVHHKEVKAALGVKIAAPGLEKAIAGARLYVAQDDDEVEAYKDLAMQDVNDLQRFASKGPGVWVQASTLGALEALLTFLQQMKIPVRNFAIGPVFRSHVLRASRMLDVASEYALILAFDVPIDKDAKEYADKEGVKIFSAMIIYHLFDAFTKYMAEVQEAKRQAAMPNAVWPVKLKILKAFAHRDPIVLGVDIIEGTLRTGTPVGVVKHDKETGKREIVALGKITSIEINHKPIDVVKRTQIGAGAAIKIERASYQAAKLYGRHFDDKDEVVSLISRQSIDTLKANFRDQVDMSDWALIKKMKVEQGIP